jgi:GT2 family glycosyltransferase
MMGCENWFVNESRAYHMGSASSGKNPSFPLYMTYRNNALVLIKNLPWRIIAKALPGLMAAEHARLRGFWREGKYSLIKAMVKGRLNSLVRIPIFLRKRRQFKKYWTITEAELWQLMELKKLPKIPAVDRPYGSESITIVVLSHNNMGRLESCLSAIASEKYPDVRIIVVDNNSTDGSVRYIEEKYPRITVLAQKANLGIANGFNVGLTKALLDEPDYFALIQANTMIEPGWIDTMVETFRKQPSAFAVTSKVLAYSNPKQQEETTINQGYSYHPSYGVKAVTFNGKKVREVFAASDYASMYRTDYLKPIGLMDGDFFNHLEDVDFSFRAHLAGYKIYSHPGARAHTALTSPPNEPSQWYHAQKNLFFIYVKNLPFKLFWKYFPVATRYLLNSNIAALKNGFFLQQLKAFLKCTLRLPRMLRYRRRINIHRRERAAAIDRVLVRYR